MIKVRGITLFTIRMTAIVGLVVCLGGCMAAVWPSMTKLDDLPTKSAEKKCSSPAAYVVEPAHASTATQSNSAPASSSSVPPPIDYACMDAAIGELWDMEGEIGNYHRAMAYTTVGAGTYAGYLATRTKVAAVPLRNAGVAIAGLLGFHQATGADTRLPVLVAGVKALSCVESASMALENTSANDLSAPIADPKTIWNASLPNSMEKAAINQIHPLKQEQIDAQNAITLMLDTVRVAKIAAADQAFDTAKADYVAQLIAAKRALPTNIRNAVASIRMAVYAQINSNQVDLQALFSQQQQAVEQMAGSVVKNGNNVTDTIKSGNANLQASASPVDLTQALSAVFSKCVAANSSTEK